MCEHMDGNVTSWGQDCTVFGECLFLPFLWALDEELVQVVRENLSSKFHHSEDGSSMFL